MPIKHSLPGRFLVTASSFSGVISPDPQPFPTFLSCSEKKPLISPPIGLHSGASFSISHRPRRHLQGQHLSAAPLLGHLPASKHTPDCPAAPGPGASVLSLKNRSFERCFKAVLFTTDHSPPTHTLKFPVQPSHTSPYEMCLKFMKPKWGHTFDSFAKNILTPFERKGKNKIYDFWFSSPYPRGNCCPINYE